MKPISAVLILVLYLSTGCWRSASKSSSELETDSVSDSNPAVETDEPFRPSDSASEDGASDEPPVDSSISPPVETETSEMGSETADTGTDSASSNDSASIDTDDSETIVPRDSETAVVPDSETAVVPDSETGDVCTGVECPDDGDVCNGKEKCHPIDGTCMHYIPLLCDDGLTCNGVELCDPVLGCVGGDAVQCPPKQVCREPDGVCVCAPGHVGADCLSCDTANGYIEWPASSGQCVPDYCTPNPCTAHGECEILDPDSYHCRCRPGWNGKSCAFEWEMFGEPNSIDDIDVDENGLLYVASEAGMAIIDTAGTPLTQADDKQVFFGHIELQNMAEVSAVTADTARGGFWATNGRSETAVTFYASADTPFDKADDGVVQFNVEDELGSGNIYQVFVDPSSDRVWFTTEDGQRLTLLDDGGTPLNKDDDQWFRYEVGYDLPFNVLTVAFDSAGGTWFGGNLYGSDSVFLEYLEKEGRPFAPNSGSGIALNVPCTGYQCSSYAIYDLHLDKSGGMWMTFRYASALMYFDDGGTPLDTVDDGQQLFDFDAGIIVGDAAGGLWFSNNNAIAYFDPNQTPFVTEDDLLVDIAAPTEWVWIRESGSDNGKWALATEKGLYYLDDGDTPSDDADDNWVAYHFAHGRPYARGTHGWDICYTTLVSMDRAGGGKWIRSDEQMIFFDDRGTPFDKADDSWEAVGELSSFDWGSVYTENGRAVFTGNGRWRANPEKGVDYLHEDGTVRTSFTAADGLAADDVRYAAFDSSGRKWFATSAGISCLDDGGTPADKFDDTWVTFTEADGLDGIDVFEITFDTLGRVWISGHQDVSNYSFLDCLDTNGTMTDKSDDVWRRYPELTYRGYQTVIAEESGGIWFGYKPFYYIHIGDNTADTNDDIWVTYENNGALIARDGQNALWCAEEDWIGYLDINGTPMDRSDDTFDVLLYEQDFTYLTGLIPDGTGGAWASAYNNIFYVRHDRP